MEQWKTDLIAEIDKEIEMDSKILFRIERKMKRKWVVYQKHSVIGIPDNEIANWE